MVTYSFIIPLLAIVGYLGYVGYWVNVRDVEFISDDFLDRKEESELIERLVDSSKDKVIDYVKR